MTSRSVVAWQRWRAMAAAVVLWALSLLLLWAGGGTGTEAVERSPRTAVPICTCDLTRGVCDLNCCCDPDCSSIDVSVFSSCLPGSEPFIGRMCIEESAIFTSNSPLPTVIIRNGSEVLFCVIVSDPKTNYFISPQSVTQEQFSRLALQYGGSSFVTPSQPPIFKNKDVTSNGIEDFYRVGQPILTFFPDAFVLGVLVQPMDQVGGRCTDRNPAGFLQSRSSTCTHSIRDLRTSCDVLPALNAATYYQDFVLLQTPNITVMSEVHIRPPGGQAQPSPTLLYDLCINVVTEVTYTITCQGQKGIVDANVTFVFSNLSLTDTTIQQTFHVFFLTGPGSSPAERRSGNPGYLMGNPVRAFSGEAPASLTIMRSSADGSCSPTPRNAVVFGHNMRAGCWHSLDPDHTCSQRQGAINLILLGNDPPDSLGILGNASGSEVQGLTQIVNSIPEAANVKCETSCKLALALDVQILWAKLGPLSNPQAAVLGARFQYRTQEVQCSSMKVSLRSSVTFVETTQYPPAPRDQPATDWKLPFDFFYPFKVSSAGVGKGAGWALGSVCGVTAVLLLGRQ